MQNKARLDNFIVLKTLGTGYTGKVKLGRDADSGALYALKILDPSKMDTQKLTKVVKSLENELNVMQNLQHKNIVKFLGLHPHGQYVNRKGVAKSVAYAVIELASKGEIFEVLFKIGPFNENMARFYMQQLVSALHYLHSNKVAHRDLKPENLLLDADMNLKLADFGFATLFDEESKNKTKLGTERYMSPELLNKKPYNAAKSDVFAAGVILFIFYSGHPPFHEGRLEDPYYNVFMKNRQKFWDFHAKQNKKRVYSESYKALVSAMLEYEPETRFSIEQVRNSAWLNEPCDEIKALTDMTTYIQAMMKTIEQTDSMAVESPAQYRAFTESGQHSGTHSGSRGNLLPADYDKVSTECISTAQSGHTIMAIKCRTRAELVNGIIATAQDMPDTKIVWNEDRTALKIKFTTEYSHTVLVKVRIYEGEAGEFKIELTKTQGPCMDYYRFKAQFSEALGKHL